MKNIVVIRERKKQIKSPSSKGRVKISPKKEDWEKFGFRIGMFMIW
jgi:hypothetical protein